MPTGYTAAIKDGITFEQYALSCARAFGACILMRDEPSDTPIPEAFEPSSYNAERLKESQARLAELETLTEDECVARARAEYDERRKDLEASIAERDALKRRYEEMLAKVEQFTPPTSEHVNFKEFMRTQITESIEFDCHNYYAKELSELKPQTGAQWKKKKIAEALRDIAYHAEEHNKEVERADSRTSWVSNLRKAIAAVS